MELYNKLRTVPETALKTIQAGRLKGKYDINPQWRYERLTEVLGVCGEGWKYTITKQWMERFEGTGEIACFVNIEFFHWTDENKWSDPIPANGGSMFVTVEKHGPYVSDECYKMALTDAIGTAAKMIGLAADVYSGSMDVKGSGTKYTANEDDGRPWLNKGENLNKAIRYIKGGGDIAIIEKKYRLSNEIKTILQTAKP